MSDLIQLWYFHIPNYTLALLLYLLLGRLILGFFVEEDWDNYIWRSFQKLTQPVVSIVSYITPDVVPPRLIMIFAIIWLWLFRITLFFLVIPVGIK